VVRENCLSPTMSITHGACDSDSGDGARRPSHTITTCVVTAVCDFTRAPFLTSFKHKSLRHRARYIHDHVIVLFDIIIE
jgi:hypothetical protein